MAESPLLFSVSSNKLSKNLMKNLAQLLSKNAFKHALGGGCRWHYELWVALPLPVCLTHMLEPTRTLSAISSRTSLEPHAASQWQHLKTQAVAREGCHNTPLKTSTSVWRYRTRMQFLPLCWLCNLQDQLMKMVTRKKSSQTKLSASKILTRHQLFKHFVGSMY